MEGWIKLHRKLLENAIFYKPDYFQVWVYILLKVNHEEKTFIWNNETKTLEKGCGIFSQKAISAAFGFPLSKVNRILNYLKNENQIEIKSTNKYTEIQVLNWSEYQEAFENGNQTEIKQKPSRNLAETNKNDKNEKNIYIVNFEEARKIYPGKKRGTKTEFENFCKKHKDWKEVLQNLKSAIQNQSEVREKKKKSGQWIPEWKNFSTWINNRCWEEETGPNTSLDAIVGYKLILDRSEAMLNGKDVYIGKMPVFKPTPEMVSIDDPRLTDLPVIKA